MGELVIAVLILVVGIPLVFAVYIGWKFAKQARAAARFQRDAANGNQP